MFAALWKNIFLIMNVTPSVNKGSNKGDDDYDDDDDDDDDDDNDDLRRLDCFPSDATN